MEKIWIFMALIMVKNLMTLTLDYHRVITSVRRLKNRTTLPIFYKMNLSAESLK